MKRSVTPAFDRYEIAEEESSAVVFLVLTIMTAVHRCYYKLIASALATE